MSAPESSQSVDVDALILSALDARTGSWRASEIVPLVHGIAHYLDSRGVIVTKDGWRFAPGEMSPQQWRRMVSDRGLLDEEVES